MPDGLETPTTASASRGREVRLDTPDGEQGPVERAAPANESLSDGSQRYSLANSPTKSDESALERELEASPGRMETGSLLRPTEQAAAAESLARDLESAKGRGDPAVQKACSRLWAFAGAFIAPILILTIVVMHGSSVDTVGKASPSAARAEASPNAARAATTAAPTIHEVVHTTMFVTSSRSLVVVTQPKHKTGLRASLVQTWKGGGKLKEMPDVHLQDEDFDFDGPTITVDLDSPQQEIVGFGGAFTEAAAVTLMKLPEKKQEEILDKYFGPDGIGYTIGRVHINSCDFSLGNYNYDSVPNDFALHHFDDGVGHDVQALIPMLQRASSRVAHNSTNRLRILASPWSPPAWMKFSNKMNGASPPTCLKPEAHATWAKYISRWMAAYKRQNINIWAMTVQNEPLVNPGWEGCAYSPQAEGSFVADFLGPTMQADHPDVDIFIYDDSKQSLAWYAKGVMQNPKVKPFVKGVAFHWYTGDHFDQVKEVHERYPDMTLLASEATYEKRRWNSPKPSDNWKFGAGYAHDVIGDLNSGASGWLDWNLLLDQNGGPNHVGNSCDAAILVDVPKQAVHVHPQYYFLGHFSKYMLPGSRRLQVDVKHTPRDTNHHDYGVCGGADGLQAAAVVREDDKIALVVLNCGHEEMDYKIKIGSKTVKGNIPGVGIQTYILDKTPKILED